MPNDIDLALNALAATQHSLASRTQLRTLGFTRAAIRHRLRTGRLEQITPVVFRIGGAPQTARQLVCATVLNCGCFAAASHSSAAALWELPGYRLDPPTAMRRRTDSIPPPTLGIVHTTTHLPDHHTTVIDGIPVTYPARLVFDLAGEHDVHPGRIERLVDTMWGRSLVSYQSLHSMLQEHAERGRPGIAMMREILDERPADHRPPDSNLEARVNSLVVEDGQEPLERQRNVGAAHWIGRMDFSDVAARVVVQVDSDIHHGSVLDQARDEAQTKALEEAGFIVVRIREFDVWHNGRDVARVIRDARSAGRRRTLAAS
jgi:very-short-patch-repair endonuclease